MEKFGVDQTPAPGEKKASEQDTCPICGKTLTKAGAVRLCPTHGSKPFERPYEQNR